MESIFIFMDSRAYLATLTSISFGTSYVRFCILPWLLQINIIDNNWFAKDKAIISGGWPSAPIKFTTLPLDNRNIRFPSIVIDSTFGLTVTGESPRVYT